MNEKTPLSSSDIQKMSGLSRRHLARLAAQGRIPGAVRGDGYHFCYKDTPDLRSWCERENRSVERRSAITKISREAGREPSLKFLLWHWELLNELIQNFTPDLEAVQKIQRKMELYRLPEYFHDKKTIDWVIGYSAIRELRHYDPITILKAAKAPPEIIALVEKMEQETPFPLDSFLPVRTKEKLKKERETIKYESETFPYYLL